MELSAASRHEADVKSNMKTRERTENAAADRAKHGDNSSARVDGSPTCLTSFGMIADQLSMPPEKCTGGPGHQRR